MRYSREPLRNVSVEARVEIQKEIQENRSGKVLQSNYRRNCKRNFKWNIRRKTLKRNLEENSRRNSATTSDKYPERNSCGDPASLGAILENPWKKSGKIFSRTTVNNSSRNSRSAQRRKSGHFMYFLIKKNSKTNRIF